MVTTSVSNSLSQTRSMPNTDKKAKNPPTNIEIINSTITDLKEQGGLSLQTVKN